MNRKQLVCSLILFLAPFFAFSQYFTLTPMGMKAFPVESEKDCKDYIVLEFPGKTQTELSLLLMLHLRSKLKPLIFIRLRHVIIIK